MRNQMGSRRTGSKVGKVLRKLTSITENITKVVNQGNCNFDLDSYSEVFKRFVATKPPVYLGKEDPVSLENWIREFDKLFDAINCPSELRVNNDVYYLREEADLWWAQRKDELLKKPNFGWDEFKEALREKFYPSYLRKMKCMEFTNLRMGNMSINEYYKKFIELMRRDNKGNFGKGNRGQSANARGNGNQRGEKPKRKYFCKQCKKDHPGKDCEGNPVTCSYCQKLGHREYDCFKKVADINAGKVRESSAPSKPSQPSGFAPKVGTCSVARGALKGRVFVMNSREAETSNDVAISVFLICFLSAKVLFDSSASHYFISKRVVDSLGLGSPDSVSLDVSIPSGEVWNYSKLFRSVPLSISRVEFPSDLIEFDLKDLDVILGMDWLGKYEAKIYCAAEKVNLNSPSKTRVTYRKEGKSLGLRIISAMQLQKFVKKGYPLFMCNVQEVGSEEDKNEIPGMPPVRDVEFTIDLVLGTEPISKAPNRMAQAEMKELKT
ncbi:uncharacterized protein LOC110733774 [Chenopodium quinoa]|uniref:uncharacterized protein LOC110733774 n=1 Tax=Chenopodium quinoa TaxID=63459 RepID=UPI000B7735DE|nr:uncharacterized protein LOC110733774 [Chenopodium quinoa]